MESLLKEYLERQSERVNRILDELLPCPTEEPQALHQAMRYSVFAGGKRLRPALVIASAEAVAGPLASSQERKVLQAAAAVELLHTYSLVHDDLPAMDNDDWRRGKATCHKAYDEATAILVGDALQALAFLTLANLEGAEAAERNDCIQDLGCAAGSRGMVGGQMMDLVCQGIEEPQGEQVEWIHRQKTGAIMEACCRIGARLAGGTSGDRDTLGQFGATLGLAFQIIDDILDVVGEHATLGKSVGKDQSARKVTYPSVYGLEVARSRALGLIEKAKEIVSGYGEQAQPLRAIADYMASRDR